MSGLKTCPYPFIKRRGGDTVSHTSDCLTVTVSAASSSHPGTTVIETT